MKRIGILIFALALALCGCAPEPAAGGGEPGVAAGPEGEAHPTYYLAVSNRARDEVIAGAEVFCDKIGELSGGRVQVRLAFSENPAESLQAGSVQFAVLSRREDFAGSSLLEASATPFLYSSYLNFSMKTNAEATLSFLALELEDKNMRPLGAYYQGATHLLSDFGTENYQQYQSMVVAVDGVSGSESAFSVLEAASVESASAAERAEMLLDGEVNAAEFRLEELAVVNAEWMPGLCLTLTYHGIVPAWLMMDASMYNGLDRVERAVLEEACAYMTNAVDDYFTALEREWINRALDFDIEVFYEVIGTRNRIRNNKYGKIWEITDPDNAFAVDQFLTLMGTIA